MSGRHQAWRHRFFGIHPLVFAGSTHRFVSDTLLGNHALQNCWTSPEQPTQTLRIFYSQQRGIEAFATPEDLWWRTE